MGEFQVEPGFYVKRLADGRIQFRITVEQADHSPTLRRVMVTQVRLTELLHDLECDGDTR